MKITKLLLCMTKFHAQFHAVNSEFQKTNATSAGAVIKTVARVFVCTRVAFNCILYILQTKDLTDTLIDNMSSLASHSINKAKVPSSNSFSSVPSMGVGMGFSSSIDNTKRNITNGLNTNMGFQTAGFSMGAGPTTQNFFSGPSATTTTKMNIVPTANMPNYSPMNAASAISPLTQQNRPPDMSALDNLFGPQKPKVSMKQLAQQKSNQWVNQFVPPQGSPGTSTSVLGPQMNMIGQPGFGIQGNPFFAPQNFAQPANTMTNSSSASNDLKDLFG